MAKDKKSAKAGKADKAGIKIPKKLRKVGKKAMKLASKPAVSEVVAAALLSAAEALRENEGARRGAVKAGKSALDAVEGFGRESGKLGDSLRKLALDLARKTLDNWDRADGGAAAAKPAAKPKAKAASKPKATAAKAPKPAKAGAKKAAGRKPAAKPKAAGSKGKSG